MAWGKEIGNKEVKAVATVGFDKLDKYLTFALGEEEYGLEILNVKEIIGLMRITKVPKMPKFVRGVINLRGSVIPVIDLRLKFGMDETAYTEETCIIVVDLGERLIGAIVDKVSEVLDIAGSDIDETPSFGSKVDASFVLGIGKIDDKVVILLDVARALVTETGQMGDSTQKRGDVQ